MDDGGRALLGDAAQEFVVHLVDGGELAGLLGVPLAVPALELAGDVALVLAEIVEADGLQIDRVDGRHRVDQRLARMPASGGGEDRFGADPVAQHVAVDEAHHVERGVVDRLVGAVAERRRDRDVRALQRRG